MVEKSDRFEEMLRQKLEGHEEAYNPAHWQEMDSMLAKQGKAGGGSAKYFVMAAALAGAVAVGAYFMQEEPEVQVEQHPIEQTVPAVVQQETVVEQADPVETEKTTVQRMVPNTAVEQEVRVKKNTAVAVQLEPKVRPIQDTPDHQVNEPRELKTVKPEEDHPVVAKKKKVGKKELVDVSTLEFEVSTEQICINKPVHFSVSAEDAKGFQFWILGDGKTSSSLDFTHYYEKPGSYPVRIAYAKGDGYVYTSPREIEVHAAPQMDFDFAWSKDRLKREIEFDNNGSHYNKLTWHFGDGSMSNEEEPTHHYNKAGNYRITLLGENDYGCAEVVTKDITVHQTYDLLAPNVFTPDGNDLNDNFIPTGLTVLDLDFVFQVFDNKGRLVYETEDPNQPWDGRSRDGKMVSGNYLWTVSLVSEGGVEEVHSGSVFLSR